MAGFFSVYRCGVVSDEGERQSHERPISSSHIRCPPVLLRALRETNRSKGTNPFGRILLESFFLAPFVRHPTLGNKSSRHFFSLVCACVYDEKGYHAVDAGVCTAHFFETSVLASQAMREFWRKHGFVLRNSVEYGHEVGVQDDLQGKATGFSAS